MTTEVNKFADFPYLCNSNQWPFVYPEVIVVLAQRHGGFGLSVG